MYEFEGEHYLSVGLSALSCVDAALGPDRSPTSVLDFACGYGRVLRFLRVSFPEARLAAVEIERPALRFCARAFGVSTFASTTTLESLRLPDRFDLIWCGSLITHLDRPAGAHLLRLFAEHLSEGGICLFSAHGEVSERALRHEEGAYGLSPDAVRTVLEGFDGPGYGYANYAGHSGYGVSLVAKETLVDMAEEAGLQESSFQPRGWDDHHDVYGFVLRGTSGGASISP
jgi:SAM-dependent methyltransferase